MSIGVRKKQRFFCCIGLAALLLGGVLLAGGHIGRTQAALTLAESNLRLKNADDNQTRVDFLNRLGWQVGADAVEVAEVVIPLEFDEVYQNYNQIQQEQGFDDPHDGLFMGFEERFQRVSPLSL